MAISNPWNYAPVKQVLGIFQAGIKLAPIQSGQYKVNFIYAQPAVDEDDVTIPVVGSSVDIQIALTYYISFGVQDINGNNVTNGSAILINPANNFNLNLQTTDYMTWTFKSLSVVVNTQLGNVGCNVLLQPTLYQQLVTSLTTGQTSIPQQLTTYFASTTFTDSLKNSLTQFTDFASTYTYTYTNINQQKLSITYDTTYSGLTNSNNVISGQRAQTLIGFTEQPCSATGAQLPNPLPGTQVEVYAFEALQTAFEYAEDLDFYDTILGAAWNSPIFQFYAASLKNILSGVDENFLISSPSNGKCTQLDSDLTLNGQTLSTWLSYSCTLYNFGQTSGSSLITAKFTLTLNLIPNVQENKLMFFGSAPTVTQTTWSTGSTFQLVNEPLANLYLQSVVENAFLNRPVYGSYFPTLTRTSTKFQWANNQLIIYQATSSEQ